MKLEELCAAVQEARYYNERFTRREYTSAFRTYTERFGPLYMEAVRETAEDPDGRRVLAEQLLDLLEAGWKRQRPWNRTMVQAREKQMLVTYLSPMLLGLEEPLCQELAERLRDFLITRFHLKPNGRRQVLEGDVVVHLFDTEARAFYDLDRLWQDAVEVDLTDILQPQP